MTCLTPNCSGVLVWVMADPPFPAHFRCPLCGSAYSSNGKRMMRAHMQAGKWGRMIEKPVKEKDAMVRGAEDPLVFKGVEVKEVTKMEENHEDKKYVCNTEGCNAEISEKRFEGAGLCSKCQTSAWQKGHRRVAEPKSEAWKLWKCDCGCGKTFTKTRHDQRFFSKECRNKFAREEKRRKAKEALFLAGKGKPVRRLTPAIPERLLQGPKTTPELLAAADRLRAILQEMLAPIEKAVQEVKYRFAL